MTKWICGLTLTAFAVQALVGPGRAHAAEEVAPSFAGMQPGENAEETYELNSLGLLRKEVVGTSPNVVVVNGKSWEPQRGKYRLKLSFDEFYRIVGRPDLESRWMTTKVAGSVGVVVGMGALVTGMVLIWRGLNEDGISSSGKVGLGLAAGGLLTTVISALFLHPPSDEGQALEMMVRYNEALRGHLGLRPLAPDVP